MSKEKNEVPCWVYVDSGECVEAATVEEAIAVLRPRYPGYKLTMDNVVTEAEAGAIIRAEREAARASGFILDRGAMNFSARWDR